MINDAKLNIITIYSVTPQWNNFFKNLKVYFVS